MAAEWFYSSDGFTRTGPVTWEQLRQLANGGHLQENHLIWKAGMPDWKQACGFDALFPMEAERAPEASFEVLSSGETCFWKSRNALVTNRRLVCVGTTYPLSAITSVEVVQSEDMTGCQISFLVLGSILLIPFIIGIAFLILVLYQWNNRFVYSLRFTTAAGQIDGVQGKEMATILKIKEAIDRAIIAH